MQYVILAAMFWFGFAFGMWLAPSREKPTQTCLRRIAHIPLRVVFYHRGDDGWTAHCLEFDLSGSGATREDALERLTKVIAILLDRCLKQKDPSIFTLFSPASEELCEMFAGGKDVVVDNLEICFGRLADVASKIVVREYSAELFRSGTRAG